MIRPRWALAALAAGLLAIPSVVHAQYAAGQGSLGGTLGYPIILAPGQLKWGQMPRIVAKGNFQYVVNKTWRTSLKFGYGWVGWSDKFNAPFTLQAEQAAGDTTKGDQLLILNPYTAVVQYTHPFSKNWMWYAGAGPGFFHVNITNDGRTIYDPVTHERFSFTSFGLAGEGGAEYFLPSNKNVSFTAAGTLNYLLDSNKDKYPSGYSGKYLFMDLSLGVNVYFKPLGAKSKPAPVPSETQTGASPADTTSKSP